MKQSGHQFFERLKQVRKENHFRCWYALLLLYTAIDILNNGLEGHSIMLNIFLEKKGRFPIKIEIKIPSSTK